MNIADTRRVWAAVSEEPRITRRVLAKRLRLKPTAVQEHLNRLAAIGYVELPGQTGPRCGVTVLVPLREVK
jgi:predicted ArsR family transcriptional regulator